MEAVWLLKSFQNLSKNHSNFQWFFNRFWATFWNHVGSQNAFKNASKMTLILASILEGFWLQKCQKVEKNGDEILSRILEAKKELQYAPSAGWATPKQQSWHGEDLVERPEGDLDACRPAGGRANCLRFANPAEATQRLWDAEAQRMRGR